MGQLTPDERNQYYLLEASRTGIHKPILAALYQAHLSPQLSDGEMGLGMVSANQIFPEQLDTFPEQVQYAANTIRTVTDTLISQNWQSADLWDAAKGHYSDKFLKVIADGHTPSANDTNAARLEPCQSETLIQAYLADIEIDYQETGVPDDFLYLDRALLTLIDRIANYYVGLSHQREAILEAIRIWRKLSTYQEVIQSLVEGTNFQAETIADSDLDRLVKDFIQRISPYYGGYPHQREALLRLTQLWRRLESREEAIASLKDDTSPDEGLDELDPALIAFVERIPQYYEGKGWQRNAITECVRLWKQLDNRTNALTTLGINASLLNANPTNQEAMKELAIQVDRELLNFIRRVSKNYEEKEWQREALIRTIQLWRNLATREQTINSLTADLKRLENERQQTQQKPLEIIVPSRPARWTPNNIQLAASIIPDGNFTWAEATRGGTRMPPDQQTVDAMIRIAKLAQRARDRIARPFIITSWYRPPHINRAIGGARYSRHIVGDAIDFTCENISGNQLYWMLDPWWPGGLGRYTNFPNLCHLDARSYRARWRH